jgi:spore germination protein YaaH
MNKITAITIGATALLVTTATTYFLLNNNTSTPTVVPLDSIPISSSATPTPTETVINDEVGRFIILPDTHKLSDSEASFLSSNAFKTVFVIESSSKSADLITAQAQSKGLIVERVGDNEKYTKCTLPNIADSEITANMNYFSQYILNKGDCNSIQKIIDIYQVTCDMKSASCQTEIQKKLHSSSYLYFPSYPFAYSFAQPSITTEIKNGIVIATWDNPLPRIIGQKAYSLEYLDSTGKRLFASGKIPTGNKGDYFMPTTALKTQEITVKLRIWYSIDKYSLSNPQVYTNTFTYNYEPVPNTTNTTVPVQMSWIPDWGMASGITSVQNSPSKWHTISPVWFTPNRNGTLNTEPTTNSGKLIPLLRANKIKIVPTISLFDADILKDILRNDLENHATAITNLVVSNNYDGIDLDYESTYEDDKDLLIKFLTLLANKLHAKNKILVFTAMAKIDDRGIYAYLPQTHKAQDWKAIGAIVDEFRIMAYDYTGQGSKQPGPLSPLVWNELLIQYAIANMPANKVVLALPLYAHGWVKPTSTNLAGTNNDQSLSSGQSKNTISPQHENIEYMKTHSTYYRETYDPWYKEVRVEVKYNGVERVMYYLNRRAINERIDLAKKYGIKGVCYWRIGGEML